MVSAVRAARQLLTFVSGGPFHLLTAGLAASASRSSPPQGTYFVTADVAIAPRLFITEKAVSKHAAGIFAKLDLAPSHDDNRRVFAVLAHLDS